MNLEINGVSLDEYQIKAITSEHKSTLVCAGAGSGKTLTILGYIKYLIDYKKVKEDDILCISFTNETVNSLKQKLINMNYDIDVKTFHKLGLYILNNNKYTLIDDNYLNYIIDEYFFSYMKYNNSKIMNKLLFSDKNYNKLINTNDFHKIKILIFKFIKLSKSNNMSIIDIYNLYKKSHFKNKTLLKIILEIYTIYIRELESSNKIDFDDIIKLAKNEVYKSEINYKYIIIDEFQDTSLIRYELIKEIVKKCNSSVFIVGDDYQSIYRFSGCSVDLFLNFDKYFDDPIRYDLKYTYRNSNELIYVSSNFIMKNKKQLRKNIISNKNRKKPIKITFGYNVYELLELLNYNALILGRNNSDIKDINFDNKLTIHKSKGLEHDYVILVNSDNIPSKLKEDKLLNFANKNKDYVIYEEERRLFYVALTRTRNDIYLMVNKKTSPFIKELIYYYKNYIEILKKS